MKVRRGFTLVELMVASGILALVIGGTLGAFVALQRMTRTAFAESELAIGMRQLREKLQFHAAPPHDGRIWTGVLSGVNSGAVIEGGTKILMGSSWGFDQNTKKAVSQRIELVTAQRTASDGGTRRWFVNDGDRYDESWTTRWLIPSGISWLPADDLLVATELAKRNVFYINLEATSSGVTRRERITVPVFGKAQRTFSGKVFDDD